MLKTSVIVMPSGGRWLEAQSGRVGLHSSTCCFSNRCPDFFPAEERYQLFTVASTAGYIVTHPNYEVIEEENKRFYERDLSIVTSTFCV